MIIERGIDSFQQLGTGARTRSFQDVLRDPPIRAADFSGANEREQIENAIASLSAGGMVDCSGLDTAVDFGGSDLVITTNSITLLFHRDAEITGGGIVVKASGVMLIGGGEGNNGSGAILDFASGYGITIGDSTFAVSGSIDPAKSFNNVRVCGFRVFPDSTATGGIIVYRTVLTEIDHNVIAPQADGPDYGVRVIASDSTVSIHDNHISGSGAWTDYGVSIENVSNQNFIERNVISAKFECVRVFNNFGCVIKNNPVIAPVLVPGRTSYGVRILTDQTAPSYHTNPTIVGDCIIKDNEFEPNRVAEDATSACYDIYVGAGAPPGGQIKAVETFIAGNYHLGTLDATRYAVVMDYADGAVVDLDGAIKGTVSYYLWLTANSKRIYYRLPPYSSTQAAPAIAYLRDTGSLESGGLDFASTMGSLKLPQAVKVTGNFEVNQKAGVASTIKLYGADGNVAVTLTNVKDTGGASASGLRLDYVAGGGSVGAGIGINTDPDGSVGLHVLRASSAGIKLEATGQQKLGIYSNNLGLEILDETNSKDFLLVKAARILEGTGSPEGVVTAAIGSMYRRTDGGAGTSLYIKESGTGNTGWVGK
jgi:hypothetical protein